MEAEQLLLQLTSVIALGMAAQAAAARLKLPAIFLMLLLGCAVGPGAELLTGSKWIAPELLLGDLLRPAVSLAVALVLFEGGLSLKWRELHDAGQPARNLLLTGIFVTGPASAVAVHWTIGLDWPLAMLAGAILVVTGPTVIVPLLRQVRPRPPIGPILKWEGIVIDPLGAVLAVLVFEMISATGGHAAVETALLTLGRTALIGIGGGVAAAALLIWPFKRYWIADSMQSPVTLAVVGLAFAVSNHLQHESGLLTVTVMGVVLANQRWATVQHIIEFKENLRILLISTLFILLASRINADQLRQIHFGHVGLVALLILVIRPLAVVIGTLRSPLNWRQRLYLSLISPRGIVAAAVSTVFALELADRYEQADQLVPTVFFVIFATVAFSGLIASVAARALGLVAHNPQGVLFFGADEWVRKIAQALDEQDIAVIMVDTNRQHAIEGAKAGLRVHAGNIMNHATLESLDLSEIRRMLAMTPSDEANALAAVHMIEVFGREELYQIPPANIEDPEQSAGEATHLRGRYLFDPDATWWNMRQRFEAGAVVKTTKLTEQFDYERFRHHYGRSAMPLFVLDSNEQLRPITVDNSRVPRVGDKLIFLLEGEVERRLQRQRREQEAQQKTS